MKEKNDGIEWLRILSMMMIVTLHVLGQGGILSAAARTSAGHYRIGWLYETAAFGAVDCFALISGYVGVNSSFRPSRLLKLWLQTVFYTLGLTALCACLRPDWLTKGIWLKAALPFTMGAYWYVTAYAGLLLLAPLLNRAVRAASAPERRFFLAGAFLLMCVLPTVTGGKPYGLGGGYSMIWLTVLYLAGAFFRTEGLADRLPKAAWGASYAAMILVSWALLAFGGNNALISYISPTITLASVSLLALCARWRVRGAGRKIASFLAPAALGVYLIHVWEPIWDHVVKGSTAALTKLPLPLFAAAVPCLAAGLYLAMSLIEKARLWLFDRIRVPALCAWADRKAETLLGDR